MLKASEQHGHLTMTTKYAQFTNLVHPDRPNDTLSPFSQYSDQNTENKRCKLAALAMSGRVVP
jgi:hypothetical protein